MAGASVMIRTAQISCRRSFTAQKSGCRAARVGFASLRPAVRVSGRVSASNRSAEVETESASSELSEKAQEFLDDIGAKWEDVEEKPAVIAISVASFIAIWAASGIIDAVNRTLLGGTFEVIGLGVTGWFVYRYLVNATDREELMQNIDGFFEKMGTSSE